MPNDQQIPLITKSTEEFSTKEIMDLTDAGLEKFSDTDLESLLAKLTWESWKCFGLKITIPSLVVIAGASACVTAAVLEDTEKKVAQDCETAGFAGSACFVGALFFCSTALHKKQHEIDDKRTLLQNTINNRR